MEHESFLDDLSANFAAKLREQQQLDAAELSGADAIEVTLSGRFLASVGKSLELRLVNGESLHGMVLEATASWLILRLARMDILIWYSAVEMVTGLEAAPRWPSLTEKRLPATVVLRDFASRRKEIQFQTRSGAFKGFIERVGADFIDIVDHERREAVSLQALLSVSCPR